MVVKTVTMVGNEVVSIPPAGWGAVEKWIVEVVSRLSAEYHFKIISLPAKERMSIPNTEFVYLSPMTLFFKELARFEGNYIRKYLKTAPVRSCLNRRHMTSWSYVHYLKKEIERHETDLFHFHQRPEYLVYTKPRKPVIMHLHNRVEGLTKSYPLFPEFFRGIEMADMIVTVSKDLYRYYLKKGVEKSKLELLYNGVDVKKYVPRKKPSGIRLLFVGNFIPRKGIIYLIRAFREIKKQVPEAELHIVGRRNEKSEYVQEARKESIEGISFVDVVNERDLIRHFQESTMLVHPAVYEAFGMTLVESMACGTPVIASEVGGIPEVIGDSGILIKPKSPEAITKAVLDLLDNRKKYESLRKKGRARVEKHFSWEAVSSRLSSLYSKF